MWKNQKHWTGTLLAVCFFWTACGGPQASDTGLCDELDRHLGQCFGAEAAAIAVAEFCDATAASDLLDQTCSGMTILISEQKAEEALNPVSGQTLQTVFVEIMKQAVQQSIEQLKSAILQSVGMPNWVDVDLSDWRFYLCFDWTATREKADQRAEALGRILADHWMQPVVYPMDGGFAVLHHPCAFQPQDVDRFSTIVGELFASHPKLFGEFDIDSNGEMTTTIQMVAGSQAIPDAIGCQED